MLYVTHPPCDSYSITEQERNEFPHSIYLRVFSIPKLGRGQGADPLKHPIYTTFLSNTSHSPSNIFKRKSTAGLNFHRWILNKERNEDGDRQIDRPQKRKVRGELNEWFLLICTNLVQENFSSQRVNSNRLIWLVLFCHSQDCGNVWLHVLWMQMPNISAINIAHWIFLISL